MASTRTRRHFGRLDPAAEQRAADRQTASLGGLAMVLLLVVVSLFLVRRLHRESALEDCLLSGSATCATQPGF